jgi:hypothetical protein
MEFPLASVPDSAEGRVLNHVGPVKFWPMMAEPTTFPSWVDQAATGLEGEDDLCHLGEDRRQEEAQGGGEQDHQRQSRADFAEHDRVSQEKMWKVCSTRSIALIPTKGAAMPPSP